MSIRQIANMKGYSRSKVHRLLHEEVSQKQVSASKSLSHFNYHDCHISIDILEKPHSWTANKILQLKKVKFETKNRVNWEEYMYIYNECRVHIMTSKVVIYPPKSISTISPEDAVNMAIEQATSIVHALEKQLELKLSNKYVTTFHVKRNHLALNSAAIYDEFKRLGFESMRDEKGDVKFILDRSNGEKHIEAVHPVLAAQDMTNLTKALNSFISGEFESQLKRMEDAIITTQKAVLKLYSPAIKKQAPHEGEENSDSTTNNPQTSSPSFKSKQDYIG